ncbi:MAG: fucose isomerase [Chlorobiota bacterium]|nr:MAG: fucose isomerase [Chlorobiota bacterium]
MKNKIYLVASGDLRLSANQHCWEAQLLMEDKLTKVLNDFGVEVIRAHGYDKSKKHGFIDSQSMGIEVFKGIPKKSSVIVAVAVWQYSHHVFSGLNTHKGDILTIANWSGKWPGLVGLLNLNASLTKDGINYSTLWSEDFLDEKFTQNLKTWIEKGKIKHDESHVIPFKDITFSKNKFKLGKEVAVKLKKEKAIMGVFDEGCMGMYNAIIPDSILHKTGLYKERLSQATLYAKMLTVSDSEAIDCYKWLVNKGVTFKFGRNEKTQLTKNQVIEQCKMYIASVRLSDEFGCDLIGIQYQQGLKDLTPASDLAEGMLNNVDRPPVFSEKNKKILYEGKAIPHFNEVDECAGLDALITNRLWILMGLSPETTLHDLRWGKDYEFENGKEFVWVLEISGAAPAEHFIGGYAGASSERQPPMYFKLGGGTLKGISKPGHIVWSRIYLKNEKLHCDIGIGNVVFLPQEETEFRWNETTSQWPIMHTIFKGVTRDQMMARHKSNHVQVAYANDEKTVIEAMINKAMAFHELGVKVYICGKNIV